MNDLSDKEKIDNSSASFFVILLLILSATGVLIDPITSSRPNDPESITQNKSSAINQEIRLWQDPIPLIRNRLIDDKHPEDNVIEGSEGSKKIPIFAIGVSGDFSQEIIEARRRIRYAVTSTFDALDFFPINPQKLQVAKFSCLEAGEVGDIKIGFEWFESGEEHTNEQLTQKALVLWLNENDIPGRRYKEVINCLHTKLEAKFNPNNDLKKNNKKDLTAANPEIKTDFYLIGPSKTPFFIDLLRDNEKNKFNVISYIATSSEEEVLKKLQASCRNTNQGKQEQWPWYCKNKEGEKLLTEISKAEKPKEYSENLEYWIKKLEGKYKEENIIRSVGTDDKLVSAMLIELWERGFNRNHLTDQRLFDIPKFLTIDDSSCNDGLVLIYELDTFYAYALTAHFRHNKFWDICKKSNDKVPLRRFTYLRGLDGNLPGVDIDHHNVSNNNANNNTTARRNKSMVPLDDSPPEHAEGRNQYDYLRRLVERIEKLDSEKTIARNGVKAIGIFGSDVYDKLIVLQALREKFKDKIFFTTDLDARFLHADQMTWTRNLIVASNFDLIAPLDSISNFDDVWRKDTTMPFRDSFQSSIAVSIFSVMRAKIEISETQQKEIEKIAGIIKKEIRPQIFEIGRTKAFPLFSDYYDKDPDDWISCEIERKSNKDKKNEKSNCDPGKKVKPKTDVEKNLEMKMFGQLAAPLTLGAIFVCFFYLLSFITTWSIISKKNQLTEEDRHLRVKQKSILLAFVVVSLIALIGIGALVLHDNREPFRWFEGISVWPNLIIRLIGLLLIGYFAILFYLKLKYAKENLSKEFFDSYSMNEEELPISESKAPFLEGAVEWQSYRRTESIRKRINIVSLAFLACILSWPIIEFLGGIHFPYRGEIVLFLNNFLLISQYFVLWVLVFWFGFEAMICSNLARHMSNNHFKWPVKILDKLHFDTSVSQEYLDRYAQFRLFAKLTESVDRLIYLPFGMMLIVVLGRSKIFDQLGISLSLALIFLLIAVFLLFIMYRLRVASEKLRENILRFYESKKLSIEYSRENKEFLQENVQFSKEKNDIAIEQIERVMKLISDTRIGIFASFRHQPALAAGLLPLGGMGGVQLIEYLYKIF